VKIAVCIKRTPDSESRFKIAASGAAIDETGLKFDIDDFAGYAVEAALQLNEKAGGGETVVYALGPDSVQESLSRPTASRPTASRSPGHWLRSSRPARSTS
jgi:electron transfer flavoprotein beta subunit